MKAQEFVKSLKTHENSPLYLVISGYREHVRSGKKPVTLDLLNLIARMNWDEFYTFRFISDEVLDILLKMDDGLLVLKVEIDGVKVQVSSTLLKGVETNVSKTNHLN